MGHILLGMLEDWKEIHRESGKGSQRAGSITSTGQLMKTSVLGKGRKQNKGKQNVFSGRHGRPKGRDLFAAHLTQTASNCPPRGTQAGHPRGMTSWAVPSAKTNRAVAACIL